MSTQVLHMTRASCPMGVRFFLGGAVPMLVLFAGLLPVAAEACEDGQCTMLPEHPTGEAAGISLMQTSGRSVLPSIGEKVTGFAFNDGLVDDFANMEDEFDDGAVQRTFAKGDGAAAREIHSALVHDHARDPYLYLETILVIAVFALSANIFKWLFSPKSSAPSAEVQPEAPAKTEAKAAEPAPIFALGGSKDFPALEQAIRAGDEARLVELLKQGGRWAVRQEDPCGCTALHVAAHCGSAAMARLLLDHGAKVDACEAWDETPLHIAARSGSVEVCELLIARGADMNAVNAHDLTPLLLGGHAQKEAVCELLLDKGAGAGGAIDSDVPPLVNSLLFRRMIMGGTPRSEPVADTTEADIDGDWEE